MQWYLLLRAVACGHGANVIPLREGAHWHNTCPMLRAARGRYAAKGVVGGWNLASGCL